MPNSSSFTKISLQAGSFKISKLQWDDTFVGDSIKPSWVHTLADGLLQLNKCCSFAFKKHWRKKSNSRKQSLAIFRATAYCTFSTCNVIAILSVSSEEINPDNVTVRVVFSGNVDHQVGETHARHFSSTNRSKLHQWFQNTQVAPSKQYLSRLMNLETEQYAAGNRDGVGCSKAVIRKISSETRLLQQDDRDFITSLMILQRKLINEDTVSSSKFGLHRPDSPIPGYIQYIQASPFGVICFNETGVRLYHEVAKYSPVFCDATGTIVTVPKDVGTKPSVRYYYSLVVKHPVSGKPPIPVAEYISCDQTVLAVSSFLQSFRRAESLLFGSGASIKPIRVIIDRSIVLLISFLHVFNMETVNDYLLRTFRIVSGAGQRKDFEKILPHACTSHVMNSAKKDCKKW